MGGIVNEAAENIQFQDQPIENVQSRNLASYWFKEPYYAARWTYFHRPSVWNRMATKGTFDWYGLTGFKTMLAGEQGIGYAGGPRNVGRPSKWILNQGARGLEEVGKGFTRASVRGMARWGQQIQGRYGVLEHPRVVMGMESIGRRLMTAGAGYRTGGLGGAISGLGWTRGGQFIQEAVGGTTFGVGRNLLTGAGFTAEEAQAIIARSSRMGVRGLVGPGRYAEKIAAEVLGTTPATLSLGVPARKASIATTLRYTAATRLMAGVSVGLNVALFGGLLAKLAYAGARRIAESAWDLKMNRNAQMLEFGSGLNVFNTSGSLTERQRAISAIQESHLNSRVSLGSEARLLSDEY